MTPRGTLTAVRGVAVRNSCGQAQVPAPELEQSQANTQGGWRMDWNSSEEEGLGVLEDENVDKSQKCSLTPRNHLLCWADPTEWTAGEWEILRPHL